MLDRMENILKVLCVGLAVLLLVKAVRVIAHPDPLGHAAVPPLPKLTVSSPTNDVKTTASATNKVTATNAATKGTNVIASAGDRPKRSRHGGMPGFGMGGPRGNLKLPAAIQARVDRIKESEILGPFMRPMPMALLGIADDDAFLRAPDGQSGMIKEGEELGGVKLLRIGINRVLVEEEGEKKELTLFDGIGGESLLPKEQDHPTNATATNAAAVPHPKEKP